MKKDNVIKEYYKIILLFTVQLMLLSVYVTHSFMKDHVYVPSKTNEFIEIILVVIIFSFCLNSIFVVKKLYRKAVEKHMYQVNKLKYSHIEEQSKIHQRHKHDLLNHLNVLGVLAQEEKLTELKRYLAEYINEINKVPISIDTGLKELDILLYSKINLAQKKDITVTLKCTTDFHCKKKRNIINLISIIGNLLDNAIDASEVSNDKKLCIHISEDPLDYLITIENSSLISPSLKEAFNKGISTKGEGRGQGLKIVKNLVEKLEGQVNYSLTDERFKCRLELPKHIL
ncbi:sensor histidine kinase [Anaerobacillus arseniciselenatis]|uniref:sensor histidine kinase n=1 Tax=Anaerobacillus arseniciselenatis TaxID=85682 RepID=UPI001471A93D|nr:GHKL domain-containing protein [Anaerobacillus arseniciselenatis]